MVVNNTFECNSATSGGGLHARWSDLSVTNNSNFWYNTAVFGGGIFIDNSNLMFNGSCTFRGNQANYTGGGIHAAKSVLVFPSEETLHLVEVECTLVTVQ